MVVVRRCRHQILRNFPSLGGPYGIYSITIHQCPLIFVTMTFVSLFHFMDSLICYFVPRGMSKDQRNDMAFFFFFKQLKYQHIMELSVHNEGIRTSKLMFHNVHNVQCSEYCFILCATVLNQWFAELVIQQEMQRQCFV